MNVENLKIKETKWKETLELFLVSASSAITWGPGKGIHKETHWIAKKLKIDGIELDNIRKFLIAQKLIENTESEAWSSYRLTTEGFKVAMENRKIKAQNYISRAILIFAGMSLVIDAVGIYYPTLSEIQRIVMNILLLIFVSYVALSIKIPR